MKLITEEIEKVKVITEEKNGKKSLFIEGIFLQADKPNRNKRLYEMRTLEREVKRYNENFIQKGRALGELGHPDGPTVNLDRVSHKICELYRDGSNFIGKAKILETPMGKIASSLLGEGVMLGVSSRGVGSLLLVKTLCLQLLLILLLIHLHPMHLFLELWKERSGCGMEESSESN
jgi:hypothetical protein